MRPGKPAIWLALALACAVFLGARPVPAQMLTAAQSSNFDGQGFEMINDVFIGRGTRGPYMLTWKNIEPGTDNVLIMGRKLVRGQEYSLDCSTGMLAFQEPIEKNLMIRVTYNKTTKALKNGGDVSMPLNMRLASSDRGSLDVLGFYKGSASGNNSSGATVLGLSGNRKFGASSDVSTMMLFSQGDSGKNSDAGGLDKAALKFGADTSFGKFALKGSFLRVGQNFTAAKDYNLQQSKQTMDLSGAYGKASDVVFASFSYKQSGDIGGASAGASQTSNDQKVVLNMANLPTLSLAHSATETQGAGGKAISDTTTDTFSLDKKFGTKTTTSASFQKLASTTGGKTTEVDTTRMAFQSTAMPNLQFRGSFLKTDSSQTGAGTGIDLGMKLTPSKKLSVDVARQMNSSETAGDATKTSVSVAANPLASLKLQGGATWNQTAAGGDSSMNFAVQASPDKRLNLAATYASTDSDQNGQHDNATVKIAANPLNALTLNGTLTRSGSDQGDDTGVDVNMKAKLGALASLEGTYGGKQSYNGPDQERHTFRLNATPAGCLKLSAGMGQNVAGASQQNNMDARVELKPSAGFQMASGYTQSTNGTQITTVRDYSGTLKPATFVEVSGLYKNREVTGTDAPDTTSVKMSLGNPKAVRVTGQYALNPEDAAGAVRRVESTALGLDLTLGALGVTGGYSANNEYLLAKLTRETQLGLKVRMFGHGSLTTGYKLAEAISVSAQSTVTYSLGYTHVIGSSFNLSLGGELTQSQLNTTSMRDQYKATAKLGMTF